MSPMMSNRFTRPASSFCYPQCLTEIFFDKGDLKGRDSMIHVATPYPASGLCMQNKLVLLLFDPEAASAGHHRDREPYAKLIDLREDGKLRQPEWKGSFIPQHD